MPTRAKVTSVEALESFRASLIVYLSKARPTLEEVSADVVRVRAWLENDQRLYWEAQVRRRAKQLEDARQALFSAELCNLREATAAERMFVHKAKRALDEAEEKLKTVKKWSREFSNRVEPLVRQLEKLHTVFSKDLPEAVVVLAQIIKTLHAYADVAAIATAPENDASEATARSSTLTRPEPPEGGTPNGEAESPKSAHS